MHELTAALAAARDEDKAADRVANLRASAAAAAPFWAAVPPPRHAWDDVDADAIEQADMRAQIGRLAARAEGRPLTADALADTRYEVENAEAVVEAITPQGIVVRRGDVLTVYEPGDWPADLEGEAS